MISKCRSFGRSWCEFFTQVLTLPPKAHSTLLHTDVKCCVNTKCWSRGEDCSAWAVNGENISRNNKPHCYLSFLLPAAASAFSRAFALLFFMLWSFSCGKLICVETKRKELEIWLIVIWYQYLQDRKVPKISLFQVAFWLQSTLQMAEWDGTKNVMLYGKS